MKTNRLLFCSTLMALFFSCNQENKTTSLNYAETKQQLFSMEHKWLEYEFAKDTGAISPFLDSTFISISADDTSNKQQELEGVYKNIAAMNADSIFIDSFKIEEPFIVNIYDNTAVVIFICHTYKTAKGKPAQKRTKFYDVWVKRNDEWKAVSSQATTVKEIK